VKLAVPLVALGLLLAPTPAQADERLDDSFLFFASSLEITTMAGIYLEVGVFPPVEDNGLRLLGLTLGSMGVSALVAYLAYQGEWSPRIAAAMHGALWSGLDLFILGCVLPFAVGDDRDGLEVTPASWALGAVGLVEGAVAGAILVDEWETDVWMLSGVGFLGALLLAGIVAGIGTVSGWSNDQVGQGIGWSLFTGLTLTITAAHIYAAVATE
jgi:hypothetical protein